MKKIEVIKNRINTYCKEINDYVKNKRQEEFKDDQLKEEKELLLQGENILDRKTEQKQRLEKMIEINEKILKEMNELTNLLNTENETVGESINETIVTLKEIRQRKADKEIEKNPTRRRVIQAECEFENDELNNIWQFFKEERREMAKDKERKTKLIELTGMKIKETLFDSNINKWSINDSEFDSRIKGHRHVCIVIEDLNNNIFGGYISKEIGIMRYHFDSKSFVFSMKRNGKWKMKKYPLKEGCYDLEVCLDENDVLFSFGARDEDGENYLKDIVIYKKDSTNKSYCEQCSYEYEGERNALCDNWPKQFEIERIIVYEMEETEEMKLERIEQEKH